MTHNGTVVGTARYVGGRPGWYAQAASFDGTWNITLPTGLPIQTGSGGANRSPYSIRVIFKATSGHTGVPFGYGAVSAYFCFISNDTTLIAHPGITLTGTTTPTDGLWHEFLFTYDGTTASTYLDGTRLATGDMSAGTASFYTTVSALGSNGTNVAQNPLTGLVQEVALYNVALTTAASYTPQSAQTDPLAANLVALYGGGALEVDRVGVALTTSPGALAVSAKAATTATLTYGTTLGGTSPYTVALHRSTTSGFTPSGGTLVATNPTFPYTDTGLTTNTPYFYVVQVTDSTPVTPQVALSNQVWVVPNGNAANVFTPNDPALSWCPGGWKVTSAAAQTVGWGNYLLVAFFGTSLTLGVDTSAMSAGQYPTLLVSLDNAAPTTTTLTSSASVALISGKANTAHTARIYVQVQSVAADVWSTPVLTTKITSLTVDVGKTLDVAIPLANSFFFWGDSITQGLKASAAGAGDATLSFPYFIAELFNCEYGMSAFGGAGWTNTVATTNIPPFYTAGDSANTWWDKYWAGQSRLVGGLMVPTFTYAAVMLGQNTAPTSGQLQAWLSLFRAACPLTTLFIITTMSGQGRAVNSADISAYKAASHDNNVYLVDMSTITNFTTASILEILAADSHPQGRGYTHVAAYMYQKMTAALAPATVATAPGLVRIGHR